MTTTVTVRARAWGAKVETNGETHNVAPNQTRDFHIGEGESADFKVTHGEKPAENEMSLDPNNVPGREENDKLLKTPQARTNESGASETTQTTEGTDSRRTRG